MENLMPKRLAGTPRRTIVAGVAALILATVLLLVYLSHYRNSVKSSNASATVLVAKAFIKRGSTAEELAKKNLWQVTAIPKSQLQNNAVTDAAVLHGQVALDDIYPGQQLVTTDFGASATSSRLSGSTALEGAAGTWRALSISLDTSHGITPQVQTDDRVDVYAQVSGTVYLLLQNVLVLAAPNQVATGTEAPTSANYILRVPTPQVPRFLYVADNGNMAFSLRPQKGASPPPQKYVNATNVLVGR